MNFYINCSSNTVQWCVSLGHRHIYLTLNTNIMVALLIQLISGAVGGNLAGSLLKNASLGTLGNSIAGILGGGLGGQILGALGVASSAGSMDVAGILSSIAGGGVGGGVLMAVIGLIKKALAK